MIDLTPKNCEKGLLVRLKDGSWRSLFNNKKVEADLLDPKFVELAVKLGRLTKVECLARAYENKKWR